MAYKRVCRIGDQAEGICNGGGHAAGRHFVATWTTGSSVGTADGLGIVRVDDIGVTDCGHTIKAVGSSSVGFCEGRGVHRVGDAVIVIEGGSGVSVTGSPYVDFED